MPAGTDGVPAGTGSDDVPADARADSSPSAVATVTGRRTLLGALAGGLCALAGCPGDRRSSPTDDPARMGTVRSARRTVPPRTDPTVGYTHLRASGNRVLAGSGSVPGGSPAVYELSGRPAWLVAVPGSDPERPASVWTVVSTDGRVERFTVRDGAVVDSTAAGQLPPGAPPVVRGRDGGSALLSRPADASALSHPVPVGAGGLLYVDGAGDVVFRDGEGTRRVAVEALPDARLVRVAPGRYALLAGRTDRYAHGALGDELEAGRVVVVDVREGFDSEVLVGLDGPVVEGTAPIAADLTGDGRRDLLVTLSDGASGARLAAFDRDGRRLGTGPGFSTGNRWRHQLCVAPFGPDGRPEVAAVETPHIGGTARFHRLRDGTLDVVAARGGVSTHAYGSRNLDGAVAGDLDGDGRVELLVPTRSRDELVALGRTADGVAVPWRLGLDGELASNLAGTRVGDSLVVGAADSGGTVRVWG